MCTELLFFCCFFCSTVCFKMLAYHVRCLLPFETEIARNSNSLLVIQVIQNDKTGQDLKPFANLTH